MQDRQYIAIDLKSFFASVECVERGLDPLSTNLVVADTSRTEKTICLAVTPSLKAHKIPGRARLFEVVERVKQVNAGRLQNAPGHVFTGSSYDDTLLKSSPQLSLDYIIAPPQMSHYMQRSTQIYKIYLKYIAPEDIHVYSIDEVFIDATDYLKTYRMTARELAMQMILDVLNTTGITATAGIGTNLYLCKVAMDIEAKHIPPDSNGVRIAQLDEMSYRKSLWEHRPLTDFWRIGRGYAKKLEKYGMLTMGDVARCSLGSEKDYFNEALLYKLFGINAELLIDHAWGWEPCRISDIKAFKPETNSISSGQVLQSPYDYEKARLIVREMTDSLVLELVKKGLVSDRVVLTLCYDIENLADNEKMKSYSGEISTDFYGRAVPKSAHGSASLGSHTSSTKLIIQTMDELFCSIADKNLTVRKIYVVAANVIPKAAADEKSECRQLSLFSDFGKEKQKSEAEEQQAERERKMQEAMLDIRSKFGNNAILKGMNLQKAATAVERNEQIGGHKA